MVWAVVIYIFKLLETSAESGFFGRKESSARGLRPTGEVLARALSVGSQEQVHVPGPAANALTNAGLGFLPKFAPVLPFVR